MELELAALMMNRMNSLVSDCILGTDLCVTDVCSRCMHLVINCGCEETRHMKMRIRIRKSVIVTDVLITMTSILDSSTANVLCVVCCRSGTEEHDVA
jgi:hypothetical protein